MEVIMKNTLVEYMYRDASNYKQYDAVVFLGTPTKEEKEFLQQPELNFIPTEVGLEPLQDRMVGFPDEDDHVYHELTDVEETDQEATDGRSISEFVAELQGAKDDVATAMGEIGLEYF
jgi:hypothetical protein